MTFRQHPAARPAGLDDRTRRPSVTATAPTVTTATDRATLSTLLREGTRQVHREAETMGFIETLMSGGFGERGKAAYADLAAQLLAIYRALEAASARIAATPEGAAAEIVFAELERTPQIEQDLEHLFGADWTAKITVLPATARYVARLDEIDSLPRYAAHAYTRYLGDLSGGQIIRTMLQRHYGLGDAGVSFYRFEGIEKAKVFKDVYRERLDAIRFDDEGRAAVVAEAQEAFRLNQALFAELGDIHL